ncbi:MAG: hypothetical protein Kow0031_03040 [Anaerolineae bacterium]
MNSAPTQQMTVRNRARKPQFVFECQNPHPVEDDKGQLMLNEAYLSQILKASRRMAEIKHLESLLNFALDEAIALVGAERGYVVLSRGDGKLETRAKRCVAGKELDVEQDHISTSVFYEVTSTGHPLVLNDAQSDPRFDGARSVINLKLRSIMCVPLVVQGEILGAMYVENRAYRNRFTEDNLPPLVLFANQAAVAIENAMLIDTLEERVATRTRQLEESWANLVHANQLRTVWLSNIAHDIRAPLSVACTALSMLQKGDMGDLNDLQKEWVGKSLAATQHTINLVNDLFYLSKLETGGVTMQPEKVDLKQFLKDVYGVALGLPWAGNVAFSLSILPQLPHITMDPLRIRQVLLNLLSNAQKVTPQGRVTLYVAQHKHEVLIGVEDSGPGIPANQQDRLFQRFQQVDLSNDYQQQGSGLGLAICRELVEMHGGRIWVESKPGQGANFMFTLPLLPQQPAE